MTVLKRIIHTISFLCIAIVCFPVFVVEAETDSFNVQRSSGYTGEEPENAIIKWCSDRDSTKIRYASANIDLAGWSPCGEIETLAYCDASGGRRYFSPESEVPHGYRLCSEGPRIYVKLHDRVMYFDDGHGSILGVDEYTEKLGSIDHIVEAKNIDNTTGYQDTAVETVNSTEELVDSVKNLGQLASNYVDLPVETSAEVGLPGGGGKTRKKPAGQGMFDKLQTMLRDILPQ
ncbi:MAG: hypothetical protein PHC51_09820 [bacterium]|nr:hypothetical protein [bacterium]